MLPHPWGEHVENRTHGRNGGVKHTSSRFRAIPELWATVVSRFARAFAAACARHKCHAFMGPSWATTRATTKADATTGVWALSFAVSCTTCVSPAGTLRSMRARLAEEASTTSTIAASRYRPNAASGPGRSHAGSRCTPASRHSARRILFWIWPLSSSCNFKTSWQ